MAGHSSVGNDLYSKAMQQAARPRRISRKTLTLVFLATSLVPIVARAAIFSFEDRPRSWSMADWSSVGALPSAAQFPAARVLVMAGRAGGWRGVFSLHSWVVVKPAGARSWTRYDVVGWGNPVRVNGWAPDGRWFGDRPMVIADISGADAEKLIPKIDTAIKDYRWRDAGDYRMWPGPNSNSFVAAVLRAVPELGLALPPNAVGRDFRPEFYLGLSDSRSGIELNLWGFAGFKLGWVEGIEFNFLGLVAGLDLRQPAIKLPGFGRIGL
jgi:hypothetical protein